MASSCRRLSVSRSRHRTSIRRVAFAVPIFLVTPRASSFPKYCCNRTRVFFMIDGSGYFTPLAASASRAICRTANGSRASRKIASVIRGSSCRANTGFGL
jgi:hypothetical protein